MPDKKSDSISRRQFINNGVRVVGTLCLGGIGGIAAIKSDKREAVWQIDPNLCVQCGNCATECVLDQSAVKCVHAYEMCGYCKLCGGYFPPDAQNLDTGAENQLCPTGALQRTYVEDPYFQYSIDEELCIGCSKCVKGCAAFGNGSLFLQIRHDICVNCNECAISRSCPSDAITRQSSKTPYKMKGEDQVT